MAKSDIRISIEIHKAKDICNMLNGMFLLIKRTKMPSGVKNNIVSKIGDIKSILKQAVLTKED